VSQIVAPPNIYDKSTPLVMAMRFFVNVQFDTRYRVQLDVDGVELAWHCLIGIAPVYFQELCRPVQTLVGRQALRSSSGGKLSSPCKHLDYAASCILSCCPFYLEFTSLADLVVTESSREATRLCTKSCLKLIFFYRGWTGSASE